MTEKQDQRIRRQKHWIKKVITGDETWVCGYDPETKQQSQCGHYHVF